MDFKQIESFENKKIKLVKSLHLKKFREKEGSFLAEGVRLAESVIEAKWQVDFGIVTESAKKKPRIRRLIKSAADSICFYEVSDALFKAIGTTDAPQGILIVVKKRNQSLLEPMRKKEEAKPLYIVLDALQEPGNIGAIFRTADAAGADAVFLTKGCADPFSEKAVRSAMGSLFHLPIYTGIDEDELLSFFGEQRIHLFGAALDKEAQALYTADLKMPSAVIFGNEGNGIRPSLLSVADHLYIPMERRKGIGAESLNVAASAAVILFEARRQRFYSSIQA
mgnify:FL=1